MSDNQVYLRGLCRHNFLLWFTVSISVLAILWLVLLSPKFCTVLTTGIVVPLISITLFFGWDGVFSSKGFISVLLIVTILFPYIRLPGGFPDVRLEFIIVLLVWGLLLLSHLAKGYPIRLPLFTSHKWFGLFGFSIMLSMTYAAWFMKQPLIWRDFWELAKLCLYFLIFVLVASQSINPTELKRYYKFALFVLILSAFIGFLQYINFAGINEIVSPYYAPTQIRGLLVQGRVTGTTPNPNEFGALMVLAASLALSGALFFQEWRMRLLCWGTLLFYVLALILTLSRTSLVSLFAAFITIIFLFFKKRGMQCNLNHLLIAVLLGCIIGIFILYLVPEQAFFRFGELATFTKATSWQGRVENWKTHFAIWLKSPWLGWGPGKADMGTVVDNEWLLLLRRYGIVGTMVFLCLFGSLFFGLSRIGKNNSDPSVVALTVALKSTFVGYIIYMALSAVYHSLQLMPILLLFLGLVYTQWDRGEHLFREC